jgi:ankyrin repeat protein
MSVAMISLHRNIQALAHKSTEVIQMLSYEELTQKDHNEDTLLHWACYLGRPKEVIDAIIETIHQKTPREISTTTTSSSTPSSDPSSDPSSTPPLPTTPTGEPIPTKRGALTKNKGGVTPLLTTLFYWGFNDEHRSDILESLLKAGDDPNHVSNTISTVPPSTSALHQACNKDIEPRAVELLLAYGANPNQPGPTNTQNATPLHMACNFWCPEKIQLLLKNGANVHAKDSLGNTPMDILNQTCLTTRLLDPEQLEDPNTIKNITQSLQILLQHGGNLNDNENNKNKDKDKDKDGDRDRDGDGDGDGSGNEKIKKEKDPLVAAVEKAYETRKAIRHSIRGATPTAREVKTNHPLEL